MRWPYGYPQALSNQDDPGQPARTLDCLEFRRFVIPPPWAQ